MRVVRHAEEPVHDAHIVFERERGLRLGVGLRRLDARHGAFRYKLVPLSLVHYLLERRVVVEEGRVHYLAPSDRPGLYLCQGVYGARPGDFAHLDAAKHLAKAGDAVLVPHDGLVLEAAGVPAPLQPPRGVLGERHVGVVAAQPHGLGVGGLEVVPGGLGLAVGAVEPLGLGGLAVDEQAQAPQAALGVAGALHAGDGEGEFLFHAAPFRRYARRILPLSKKGGNYDPGTCI